MFIYSEIEDIYSIQITTFTYVKKWRLTISRILEVFLKDDPYSGCNSHCRGCCCVQWVVFIVRCNFFWGGNFGLCTTKASFSYGLIYFCPFWLSCLLNCQNSSWTSCKVQALGPNSPLFRTASWDLGSLWDIFVILKDDVVTGCYSILMMWFYIDSGYWYTIWYYKWILLDVIEACYE